MKLNVQGVYSLALGPYATSWLTLIRKAALLLLLSVSRAPQSPYSISHLKVLENLLSPQAATAALGPQGPEVTTTILSYLLHHDYYKLISGAIQRIPEPKSKKSSEVTLLVSLSTAPLSIYPPQTPEYGRSLSLLLTHIFTIPQLPNRIPLQTLPSFVSRIPISRLQAAGPYVENIISETNVEAKVHLVANTCMFFTPHYARFPPESMIFYLRLMASTFATLPPSIFDPSSHKPAKATNSKASQPKVDETRDSVAWKKGTDDSDEEDGIKVVQVSEFEVTPPTHRFPQIDSKTLTRLQKIPSQVHIESLVGACKNRQNVQDAFLMYVLALNGVWPERREYVLSVLLALTEGNLIRSLYRFQVRTSALGRNEGAGVFGVSIHSIPFHPTHLANDYGYTVYVDPKNTKDWPALIFLCELYTQALLTMGDDEFFASTTTTTIRNPLSIDELIVFSRQLLNIAFTLYWTTSEELQKPGTLAPAGYTWQVVREKVTRCLVAIHARDSRKPFVKPDGWLVTSQVDMRNFVQAAVLEEQQLSNVDPSADDDHPTPTTSTPHTTTTSITTAHNATPSHLKPRGILAKRTIAALSPCLGVLNNIPFSIPFEVRVAIFRHFVMNDMAKHGVGDRHSSFGYYSRARVHVRRGRVAQDGFDRLSEVDLKRPIEITFVDQWGQEEAGIDGGGVFKEFFTDLCKEVFDTDRGLWLANRKNELYPNPHMYATESHSLNWYRFIGRILGKAMYEGILVDVAFASFFLAKWLGKQSFLDDLSSLDPDLYKGLIFLKHYKGNPEDLSLNFTIAVEELGVTKNVELVPGGSDISVTKENRLKYITLVSHYRLSRQIRRQSEAFFEGLKEMIDARWLRMFNQQEVQILIGGVNAPIDLDDLRQHTNYGGLYDDRHPVIVAFWKVVEAFDQEQRRGLLRGFKELVPNFSIRDAGTDSHRLPTSSTCVNLLKLPLYNNERIMREKILQAITSGAGFDLS
ncbi:hypothetical protein MD484_g7973, partial [Candolleomyces efflorescens]